MIRKNATKDGAKRLLALGKLLNSLTVPKLLYNFMILINVVQTKNLFDLKDSPFI